MTMASSRLGSVRMMSISRMMTISMHAAEEAGDQAEHGADDDRRSTTTAMPISSDSRAPWMRRESMSRPMASVPSG